MKKMIILLGCVWGMMLSCTHDEPNNSGTGTGQRVVEWQDSTLSGDAVMGMKMLFNVGNVMSVDRQVSTRSTTEYNGTCAFTTNDLIAVAVTRSGASEVVKLYRVKSDGSLEYAGGDNDPFVWKSTGETVSIRAWSYGTTNNLAYTLTPPESRDYTLETDQNTNGYLELIYCKAADKSYSGGTISLTFYHQLSRVVFNVTHERNGTLSVTSSCVGNNTSFPISARFNIPTGINNVGSWTTRSTYGTITPKTETTQSGYQKTYSAIIFPKTYTQNTKLFSIANSDGDYAYIISESSGVNLTAGNQYNYTITIKDALYLLNPLWYLSNYNLASTTADANGEWTADANADGQAYFTHSDAIAKFCAGETHSDYRTGNIKIKGESGITFHMGTLAEVESVYPITPIVSNDLLRNFPTPGEIVTESMSHFGYNSSTKTSTARKSYWNDYATGSPWVRYAIRFLGTPYCSAWRYSFNGTGDLVINARIIPQMSAENTTENLTALSQKLTEIMGNASFWDVNENIGSVQRVMRRQPSAKWSSWGHYRFTDEMKYYVRFNGLDYYMTLYDNDDKGVEPMGIILFRDN